MMQVKIVNYKIITQKILTIKTKIKRVEQIIKLVDGVKRYDILEELKNTPPHI